MVLFVISLTCPYSLTIVVIYKRSKLFIHGSAPPPPTITTITNKTNGHQGPPAPSPVPVPAPPVDNKITTIIHYTLY
eukprot:scaffold591_cov174-Ochromonas_danica.AAC.9